MKNFFGILIVMYGAALSAVFGAYTLVDYEALQVAATQGSERSEVRHRMNVGFEGVWFLMSNVMLIQGLSMATSRKKD